MKTRRRRAPRTKFSISAERSKLAGVDAIKLDQQLTVLASALGHMPRDDSRMAFLFASGQTSKTLAETANEINLVNALYDRTDYRSTVEASLRDIATKLHEDGLPWGAAWQIVRSSGPVMLKLEAMDQLI